MNELIFFINKVMIGGAVIGSIYAMGAIGVTLIFAILRFAHFAHSELMTLGAFLAFAFALMLPGLGSAVGLPTAFLVLPLAMAATALAAILLDRVVYKPLRAAKSPPVAFVMASIGVMLILRGLVRLFAGAESRPMYLEGEIKDIFRFKLPFEGVRLPITITEPQILLFLVTALAVLALHLFLSRSRLGKAMRAMSDNPDLARVSGIDTDRVVAATWTIGAALATAAAVLLALDVTLKPDLSFNLVLPFFAAAIVGGVGRPFGAVAGGFLVGFAETASVFNWAVPLRPVERAAPEVFADLFGKLPPQISLIDTEYKLAVPFAILIVVLIVRPTGIFRGKVI